MRRPLVAALVSLPLFLALPIAPARADGESILLVVEDEASPTARRVEAELASAGFALIVRTHASAEPLERAALLAEARKAGTAATVRLRAAGDHTEVEILACASGKAVVESFAPGAADDDANAILATKTTELLRASLLEARPEPVPPTPPPATDRAAPPIGPPTPVPAPPAATHGFVGVGAAFGYGGAVGSEGLVVVDVRGALSRLFAAGADVAIPVGASTIQEPQGSSSQIFGHASVALDLLPLGPAPRVAPFVGVTAGALWLHATGTADAPYTSQTANLYAALAGAHAGALLRATSLLGVRAQVDALGALPDPALDVAGHRVARLAEPLVEGRLDLELAAW